MARGAQPTSPPASALPVVSFEKVEDSSNKPHGVHDAATRSFGYNPYDLPPFQRPTGYIHYIEPLESDLAKQVEYDMDEQDKEWLDSVNADRRRDNSNVVSCETFEIIMDRLEKEWFDLTKNLPKMEFAMPSEDSTCAICDDSEGENSNVIVFCDGCNLAVHQDCYGVPYIPEGQWLCRKCTASPETPVSCVLCPNEGGAFKQTQQNDWVHLLCAIWIPETSALNPTFMEPITGVESIEKNRWKLKCSICNIKYGACIQCNKGKCYEAFHPTCARKEKLLLPMKSVGDGAKLAAYCERHLPEEQKRIRAASLAAEEASEENNEMLSKSARAYAKTYKPAPPIVPALILDRIMIYTQKIHIRKKPEFVAMVCRYWSLKREVRRGAPLLKRLHLEPWTANHASKVQTEEEKQRRLEYLLRLKADLLKVRQMLTLTLKREQQKAEQENLIRDVLNKTLFSRELALHDAFKEITAMDRNDYFRSPVSKAEVPDYFDIVKRPICWNNIEDKLSRHEYWDIQAFKDDIQLVIDNAILYNKNGTTFNKAARRIQERSIPIFERLNLLVNGPPETEPEPTPSPPPPPTEPQPEVHPNVQRVVRLNLPASPLHQKYREPLGALPPRQPVDALPLERSGPSFDTPPPKQCESPFDLPPPEQSELPFDASSPEQSVPFDVPPEQSSPPTDPQPKTPSPDPQPATPPPVEESIPQKVEEPDTHPLLPTIGDLEPPLQVLDLLLRPDAIASDLPYELPAGSDPISYLFAFDLGIEKVKPEDEVEPALLEPEGEGEGEEAVSLLVLAPAPAPVVKPPRRKGGKKDRSEEYAARNRKRQAERAARERAKAEAAAAAAAATAAVTAAATTAMGRGTSTSASASSSTTALRTKPQPEYPAVVDSADGLDKRSSFALFETGWILPDNQKRNGRKAPPPVPVTISVPPAGGSGGGGGGSTSSSSVSKKKERRGKDRTSSLSRSTAPSENRTWPDDQAGGGGGGGGGVGMDVDDEPPSASASAASFAHPAVYGTRRQSRLEAELTAGDLPSGAAAAAAVATELPEKFPRLVREHGRAIIEELESPASRREKARKKKERRMSGLAGGVSEPEPSQFFGAESVSAVSGDVEMGDEESELSDVPDEVMEDVPPLEPSVPPLPLPPLPPPVVEDPSTETTPQEMPQEMLLPLVIPRPPYEPLPRQYSSQEFKKAQSRPVSSREAAAMLARGRMKESEAVPDTLVWAKGLSFPWFPSVIFSREDFHLIPNEVQKIGRQKTNVDKYLVKYYDQEGSWGFVALKDMVKMFEDEILDQDLLAEYSAVQRWKKSVSLDHVREAYTYAKQQWEQPEPEDGSEMPLG